METWATTRDLVAIYAVRRRRRVNDRGVATIHSHVVVWISSHSGREKEREREREREREAYIRLCINDPSGLDFKREPATSMDGARPRTTKRAKPHCIPN